MITEWILDVVQTVGAGALGFVAGQLLQWKRHPERFIVYTPTVQATERSKRLGTMLLGLLAVVTVASSTLTSFDVQRDAAARAEFTKTQRECTQHLAERLAERVLITEADHANTTRFVESVQEAMSEGPEEDTYPRIVAAAEAYIVEQDRLASERRDTPMDARACQ